MAYLVASAEMVWDFSQDLPQNDHFIKAWASQIVERKVVDGALQGVALKHPSYFSVYEFKKPVPLELADLVVVEMKAFPGSRNLQLYVNLKEPSQSYLEKKLIEDGEFHHYVFDLREMPNLRSAKAIKNIRINPISALKGGAFAIKNIRLTGRNGFEPGVSAVIPKAPAALKVPHFFQLNRGGPADAATSLELSYTDEGLQIQFSSELNNVIYKADAKNHDGAVYKDDCFDIALRVSEASYYQIVFNPLGTVFDQVVTYTDFVPNGVKINSWLGSADRSWSSTCVIDSKIAPGRWYGTCLIPWTDFRLTAPPKNLEMNIVRCSVADGKGDSGWNYSPIPSFAVPENMRKLTLGTQPSAVVTATHPAELYPGSNQLFFANPDLRRLECKAVVRDHSTGKAKIYETAGEVGEIVLNYEIPEQTCDVLMTVRENGQMIFQDDFKVDGGEFRKRFAVSYDTVMQWPSTGIYAQAKPSLEARGRGLVEGKSKDYSAIREYIADVERTNLELQQQNIYQATIKNFNRSALPFAVASASSAVKVFHSLEPGVPPFAGKATASLSIESAANEIEGVQLVLLGMKKEVRGLTFELAGKPSGKVPRLSLYGVDFLDTRSVQETSYKVVYRGEWPEVLSPLLPNCLVPGEVRSIWVKAETAADVPAGEYSYQLNISWDGMDVPLAVPMTVKVWDFALPVVSKLRNACSSYEGFVHGYYQKFMNRTLTNEEKQAMTDHLVRFMLKNRMNPGYIYTMRAYGGQVVEYPDLNRLEEYRRLGLNTVPVGQMPKGNWSCTAEEMMKQYYEPERFARFLETIRRTYELGRKQGMEQVFFLHAFDELFAAKDKENKIAAVKQLVSQVRAVVPEVKMECSSYVEPDLIGLINIWCPSIKMMEKKSEEYWKRQAAGDELWLYTCLGAPGHVVGEPPSFVLEETAAAMRLIGWICHLYKADGFAYYAMNHWHRNGRPGEQPYPETPWNMQYVQTFNGEASLIYPGRGFDSEPLSSIRFENLRDGFEDYDYLKMLEELRRMKAASLTPEQMQEIDRILSVRTLVRSGSDYTDEATQIMDCRRQMATWIEKLRRL